MKNYFAYIRVSTQKQGAKGVSLQEQKSAIEEYANRHGLSIKAWFEERETAAKTGRTKFTEIVKRLQKQEADGLIVHKIDRSARNLRDWAALGELIDQGIDIQIASESYDLTSRGGRLSADIQAVIAADYIRNLREETIKGMRGRLKQGLYPLKAPVGYIDNGGGKPKTIDPVMGPLVRQAFELYASGRYSLRSLENEVYTRGLRTRTGKRMGRTGLCKIFRNPFYCGTILINTTKETYRGIHKPLISEKLFKQVGKVRRGKAPHKTKIHRHAFARMFKCKLCGYSLVGESQKGHIYYRCHTSKCPTKTIREDELVSHLSNALKICQLNPVAIEAIEFQFDALAGRSDDNIKSQCRAIKLRLEAHRSRLSRLTDLYIDGEVSVEAYTAKKTDIECKIDNIRNELDDVSAQIGRHKENVDQFLEHAKSLASADNTGRDGLSTAILEFATSNRTVSPDCVEFAIQPSWLIAASGGPVAYSGRRRDRPRNDGTPS